MHAQFIARGLRDLTAWSGTTIKGAVAAVGLSAVLGLSAPASAQQALIYPGALAVTGFAGLAANPPPGGDPREFTTINLDGPSLRIVDVRDLGPQGTLSQVPKTYTANAGQVGQVFGVALDSAPQPNIYVAASSAFGLSIYLPDQSGSIRRIRQGQPGAQFVPGQFGPAELGGGPGSIWRIDGVSGEVVPFAMLPNAAQSVAALGGLAFDPVTQQLFVVERASGEIHRLGLDGTDREAFDHGTRGRTAAGMVPIPAGGTPFVSIENPGFDTQNPATWGMAQPARRLFGLSIYNRRLFYAVAQGPQIWSVGIGADGAFGNDARLEVEVAALASDMELGQIAFDGQGRMYAAERGGTTGDFNLAQLANPGLSRVLRFVPRQASEPGNGRWRQMPEQYAIGMPQPHTNANGGVALGHGYQNDNLVPGQCGATVWSTGERLLENPNIDGLQGNATSLVMPQNVPPMGAWYIDYDDQAGDPSFRGYMGAIAAIPCAGQPANFIQSCPPGTYSANGQCLVIFSCPVGTFFRNGACVYRDCPDGTVRINDRCVPPPQVCPPGTFYYNGRCAPLACPPGLAFNREGYCSCPPGLTYYNGRCVPPNNCPPGMIAGRGGVCWCPDGMSFQNGRCQPMACPPGQFRDRDGDCQCPRGQFINGQGRCEPIPCSFGFRRDGNRCEPICGDGMIMLPGGLCVPKVCRFGEHVENFRCVPDDCPRGQFLNRQGQCEPFRGCKKGETWQNGQCVPIACRDGFTLGTNGICIPLAGGGTLTIPLFKLSCGNGFRESRGKCEPIPCQIQGQVRQPDGSCKAPGGGNINIIPNLKLVCKGWEKEDNGKCVPLPCNVAGQVRQADGSCKPGTGGNINIIPNLKIVCKAWEKEDNGKCVDLPCPIAGQVRQQDGSCKAPAGGGNLNVIPNLKIVCKAWEKEDNGKCVALPCNIAGQVRQQDGSCKAPGGGGNLNVIPNLKIVCKAWEKEDNGKCVALPCNIAGQVRQQDGSCKAPGGGGNLNVIPNLKIVCKSWEKEDNGKCVALPCNIAGQIRQQDGSCKAPAGGGNFVPNLKIVCKSWEKEDNGKCVALPCNIAGQVRQQDGSCKAPGGGGNLNVIPNLKIVCKSWEKEDNGKCVALPCNVAGQVRQQDGSCKAPAGGGNVNLNNNQGGQGTNNQGGQGGAQGGTQNNNKVIRTIDVCPTGQTKNTQGECVCGTGFRKNNEGKCVPARG